MFFIKALSGWLPQSHRQSVTHFSTNRHVHCLASVLEQVVVSLLLVFVVVVAVVGANIINQKTHSKGSVITLYSGIGMAFP